MQKMLAVSKAFYLNQSLFNELELGQPVSKSGIYFERILLLLKKTKLFWVFYVLCYIEVLKSVIR